MFFSSKDLYYLIKGCVEKIVLHPETFQFALFVGVELGLIFSEDLGETILHLNQPLTEADLTRMSVNGLEIEDLWIVAGSDMKDHFVE
jgi:hypothetical protein